MPDESRELTPDELRWRCDPASLAFETTADLAAAATGEPISQARVVAAIEFGLGMERPDFNLFIAGPPRTGRTFTLLHHLRSRAGVRPKPSDWCYVHNFQDTDRPRAIRLAAGQGPVLQRDLLDLVGELKTEIPKTFESEEYEKRHEELVKSAREKRDGLVAALEERCKAAGFRVQQVPNGLACIPLKGGKPIRQQDYEALPPEEKEDHRRRQELLQGEINAVMREIRKLEKEAREVVKGLDRDTAMRAVRHAIEDLEEKYRENAAVLGHLRAVQDDVLADIDDFKRREPQQVIPGVMIPSPEPSFLRYHANVFVTHDDAGGAPVVLESNPTYRNLFGRVDRRAQFGALVTDFTMVKAGSVHRAGGGYLVIDALDVLRNLLSWDSLKRAIRDRAIKVEEIGDVYGIITTEGIKPEPIPLEAKVVMVGTPQLYWLLHRVDPDFRDLFKVKVEFDDDTERSDARIRELASFVASIGRQENLRPFDRAAVCVIVERAVEMTDDREKLTACYAELADLVREAEYCAARAGRSVVGAADVREAIAARRRRTGLVEDRFLEYFQRGDIFVDVDGAAVGQVNALSLYDLGDTSFARPARVTARVAMGRSGFLDIERESKLAGPIHTKGVMILSGYMLGTFGRERPIALAATLCFEQSYGPIEGDSASAAELIALLSALGDAPVRQDLAITGSVNQKGEIQPVGGVSRKIEGFFDVCRARGLNGTQGVVIPAQNVKNLVLREDVVEAAREGRFHVWAARTIEDCVKILIGRDAGKKGPRGAFPRGSVYAKVDERLAELARPGRRPDGEIIRPTGKNGSRPPKPRAKKRLPRGRIRISKPKRPRR
ncbi:MAG: AAA family ATPase [Planctomycetes bacterium]|nr:AAA family ATPase [Planctomycetota bacterium]